MHDGAVPLPRWLARLNRAGLNRGTKLVAGRLPGMGIVAHQGRQSGRRYRTPVNVFRRDGGFAVALTYGPDAQWVKNVLAAGRAEITTRGDVFAVAQPRVVEDPQRRAVPRPVRAILRILDVDRFLLVDLDAEPDA